MAGHLDGESPGAGSVLGVLGATGGVGASTVATVLAVRAASVAPSAVLIDAHPWGAGLDVLLGADTERGMRWPDLASARGDIDATAVLSRLPVAADCAVLSWARAPARRPDTDWLSVARALAAVVEVTVIDLPGPAVPDASAWWAQCDHLIVLTGAGIRQLAASAVVLEAVAALPEEPAGPSVQGLLRELRPGEADQDAVSAVLGVPMVGAIRDDATIGASLTRGEPVGRRRGATAAVCDRLVAQHVPGARRTR